MLKSREIDAATVVCLPHTTAILSSLTTSFSHLLLLDYRTPAIHPLLNISSDDFGLRIPCILRTHRVEPSVHIV